MTVKGDVDLKHTKAGGNFPIYAYGSVNIAGKATVDVEAGTTYA